PISTQILQPSLKAPDQRLFLLAVDETSFGVSSAQAVMQSATRFLKKLAPTDLVGLASYPVGGKQVPFTTQHSAVQNGIAFVAGRRDASFGQYHLSPSEIVDIFALDREVFARVVERECGAVPAQGCREAIRAEARAAAGYYEGLAAQSLSALR